MDNFYCVYTFKVTHHALAFESVLIDEGIDIKLMPAPREISTSCGTSAKIPCDLKGTIENIIVKNRLEVDKFYRLKESNSNSWFSRQFNKNKK